MSIFSITIEEEEEKVIIRGPEHKLHVIGASIDAAGGYQVELINGVIHATPDDGDVAHLVQVLSEYLAGVLA